jgi:hypothetical protein
MLFPKKLQLTARPDKVCRGPLVLRGYNSPRTLMSMLVRQVNTHPD